MLRVNNRKESSYGEHGIGVIERLDPKEKRIAEEIYKRHRSPDKKELVDKLKAANVSSDTIGYIMKKFVLDMSNAY